MSILWEYGGIYYNGGMEDNKPQTENNLKLAIFRTLTWFDLFNYPLTAYEVWQSLEFKAEFRVVQEYLNGINETEAVKEPPALAPATGSNQAQNLWSNKDGFYFLPGREEIIRTRLTRYNETDKKFKIALRVGRLFSFFPFVKLIAVSNIIGAHNLRAESDIDLFIVTAKNRIWLTRLFLAGLAKVLNLRPNKKTKQNKICLSFYVSDDNLNLETLKLDTQDLYFNFWLAGLVPIYGKGDTYQKLMSANPWLNNFLPNFIVPGFNLRRQLLNFASLKNNNNSGKNKSNLDRVSSTNIFSFLRPLGDFLENLSQKWQLKILPLALKELVNLDSRVIIKPGIIKLYLVDRRAELRDNYQVKLKSLGL